MGLAEKKCLPCEGGTPPLETSKAQQLLKELDGWSFAHGGKSITKSFSFKNFAKALAFGNCVGAIAEEEGHHPELLIEWGKVTVTLSTHSIGGLSENDFILAAKVDEM